MGDGFSRTAGTALIYSIDVAPDGLIYASGQGETIGDANINGIAVWTSGLSSNGIWQRLDGHFGSSTVSIASFDFSTPDPEIPELYDIYIGTNTTGSGFANGDATITNSGNANAYPKIMIKRSGGTSLTLYSIRNERTGAWLRFQYDLEDGEYLLIDTHPDKQTIWSSYKRNYVQNALLAPAALADFYIAPGSNIVTCYAEAAGSPTVTASLYFNTPYKGVP